MQRGALTGEGARSEGDAPASLDRETVFSILRSRDDPVGLRELSERVAAWENGCEPDEVTSKERKRVYAALHQSHLPKMDREGVVEYDPDRGTIELTDASSSFDVYLELVPRSELDWGEFYLGLGALETLVAALVALGVYPFRLLPPTLYLFLFGLVALVVGGVHAYRRHRARVGLETPPGVE